MAVQKLIQEHCTHLLQEDDPEPGGKEGSLQPCLVLLELGQPTGHFLPA